MALLGPPFAPRKPSERRPCYRTALVCRRFDDDARDDSGLVFTGMRALTALAYKEYDYGLDDVAAVCPEDSPSISRKDVQNALSSWDSVELETTAAERNMCATALRSFAEWESVPPALSLRHTLPVVLIRIGDAPRRVPDERFTRPLEGIRVLEFTRVIAGPVAGRTLAAYGADVLLRTTQLDLTTETDKNTLRELAKEADVFLQGYRPGGLEEKGFGPTELAKLRPGIVYASLNAWGWEGTWKDRRGFNSFVQTATGFNVAETEAFGANEPKPLPVQAIDHAAGYLLALEGESWQVRVSLAAVGQWLRSLGRNELTGQPLPSKNDPEVLAVLEDWEQADGTGRRMKAIKHSAELSLKTPVKVGKAPVELNRNAAEWI
ncbi:CoA-transferase family III [Hymenopellis radicata]|nr:CoA-transferase family III [Hymenopellis radicata]